MDTNQNSSPSTGLTFEVQTDEYRAQPIPGTHAKLGHCFVRVNDLPEALENFMKVNPRVPSRRKDGVLSGPVISGILQTLRDFPDDMALKNQGIFLLTDDVVFEKKTGGVGMLKITLNDPERHGIVNGGHTFAAIRSAIEGAEEGEQGSLQRAFVRLHIFQGLDRDKVPEIAEGLNRSKQVDDPSLENLRGHFEVIKEVMKDRPGADQIAYSQGSSGDVYITELLVYLEMFNCDRFQAKKHPHWLFARTKSALQFFEADIKANPSPIRLIIPHLPEILVLADKIRLRTPASAKDVGFQFGRMKEKPGGKTTKNSRGETLHFLDGKQTAYRVPRGWLYPMLSAFRANISWDLQLNKFEWVMPLDKLLDEVITDLVHVCVTEHRDNNLKPDLVGKRESTYAQCYDKVLLHLLRSQYGSKVSAALAQS